MSLDSANSSSKVLEDTETAYTLNQAQDIRHAMRRGSHDAHSAAFHGTCATVNDAGTSAGSSTIAISMHSEFHRVEDSLDSHLTPAPPSISLGGLAPELLVLIMARLDSFSDLLSLITASRSFRGAFGGFWKYIRLSILCNAIVPDAVRHALAMDKIPTIPEEFPRGVILQFLDKYFDEISFKPSAVTEILVAAPYCQKVIDFVEDFASLALQASGSQNLSLSNTERERFQRAFFRYDLYSKVFPPRTGAAYGSVLSENDQFDLFLGRMNQWEVEEMSCVHQYFTFLIRRLISKLEDNFVGAVLAASAAHFSLSTDSSRCKGSQGSLSDDDMVSFSSFRGDTLAFFSKEGKDVLLYSIYYLVSLGSEFIYRLVSATKNQLRALLRQHTPHMRAFLPHALDSDPAKNHRAVTSNSGDLRPPDSNLGYRLYRLPDCPGIFGEGMKNHDLREAAYVFWDDGRIECNKDSLQGKRSLDLEKARLYFEGGQSVEERLDGVIIPRAEMQKIIQEFG